MGYTHYWYRPTELDQNLFGKAVADCRAVCEALPIPLGDYAGEGTPVFSQEMVCFNGHIDSTSFARNGGLLWPADNAQGLATVGTDPETGKVWGGGPLVTKRCVDDDGDGSYESFVVERIFQELYDEQAPTKDGWFAFCKTNFRPYDLCVQCCLIAFEEHFGSTFQVHSDGSSQQWNEARDVCQHVLKYGLLFELDDWNGGT